MDTTQSNGGKHDRDYPQIGLNHIQMAEELTRSIGVDRIQVDGQGWTVANNDCVIEARRQPEKPCRPDCHVDPVCQSLQNTPSYNDFPSHTNNVILATDGFSAPELLRIPQAWPFTPATSRSILFGNVTGAGARLFPVPLRATFHGLKHSLTTWA